MNLYLAWKSLENGEWRERRKETVIIIAELRDEAE